MSRNEFAGYDCCSDGEFTREQCGSDNFSQLWCEHGSLASEDRETFPSGSGTGSTSNCRHSQGGQCDAGIEVSAAGCFKVGNADGTVRQIAHVLATGDEHRGESV